MSTASNQSFSFYIHGDLQSQVSLRVDKLIGRIPAYLDIDRAPGGIVRPSALYIIAQLCDYGDTLAIPVRTRYVEAHLTATTWDTWLTFPVKYKDLSPLAQLALTIWEVREDQNAQTPLGGTTMRLFSKHGRLKVGPQTLIVWLKKQADTRCPSSTPAKLPTAERGEVGRVERALKRYNQGDVQHIPWLDSLSLSAADKVVADHAAGEDPGALKLTIELPSFPLPVLFRRDASVATQTTATTTAASGTTLQSQPFIDSRNAATTAAGSSGGGDNPTYNTTHTQPCSIDWSTLTWLQDPGIGREDPAELKARKLARGVGRGPSDGALRPDAEERARIDAVLASPPGRALSAEDRELLWRFRRSLASDSRALTRFLKCVDWGDASEAKEAGELMAKWAPVGVADALELLSRDYQQEAVREYAVSVLRSTADEDLLDYLLQLVQALRYEPSDDSPLGAFLVERSCRSLVIASALFWYLCAELEDPSFGNRAAHIQGWLLRHRPTQEISLQLNLVARLRHIAEAIKGIRGDASKKAEALRTMLLPGGPCVDLTSFQCPCPLDPTVQLKGMIPSGCSVFRSALSPLRLSFKLASTSVLVTGSSETFLEAGDVPARMASLTLGDSVGSEHYQQQQEGSPPGSSPSASSSAVASASLAEPTLTMIYKRGDDLRQDQLSVQIIALMDRLLKREHLDLRMISYLVLPTSATDGLIEFVPSLPLSGVLEQHRTIHRFLATHHPDPSGPMGLKSEILSNFLRSCAGACVATYVLGVGDRHNDNLLLTTDGRMFHIDFGYILGRDPKMSVPPPVKLTREMVDAMGGVDSPHYKRFLEYCCEAYNILRKSANLLLSLLHLMAEASIPDVSADPDKALLKLQERLRPDLTDEEAAAWLQGLLARAPSALMPQIIETTHGWAQRWR